MSLSMVSSVIQAVIGEEIAGTTGFDFASQLFIPLLRILILLATFLLANSTFNKKQHHKVASPYNQATQSLLKQSQVMKASSKKTSGFKGKRPFNPPRDDEDALSTSVGSSDSEVDLTSSDQEEDVKGTKISISELLRHRPPAGMAPHGSLKTMAVGSPAQQRRSWDKVRDTVVTPSAQHPQVPAKAVAKMATSKAAKAAPKVPCKTPPAPLVKSKAAPVGNASGVVAAKPERIQALLSIICPDEEVAAQKSTAFPPGLEPSSSVL